MIAVNIAVLVPVALIAGVVGIVMFVVLSGLDERAVARDSLRQLDDYEVDPATSREVALSESSIQRLVLPALTGLTDLGRRFSPVGYVDKVRSKFVEAGDTNADSVDRFLAIKVVCVIAAAIAFVAVFILGLLPLTGIMKLVAGAVLVLAFVLGPDAMLNRRVEERQKSIQLALPDVLDLLTISVEAGLGFEQALDRVIASVPGPLSDEFARMLGETRAGAARSDAMRALDERCGVPELRSFVLAIIQADAFGVSIGRVLRAQSEEMRIKRRQLAQERAQKAPVKMLIPMVFCIFPALFVVVLGPAALNIAESM